MATMNECDLCGLEDPDGVQPIWYSVEYRLPELDQVVLVWHHPYIGIEKRTNPKDGNIWASTDKKYITHWMPLPQPPKE